VELVQVRQKPRSHWPLWVDQEVPVISQRSLALYTLRHGDTF